MSPWPGDWFGPATSIPPATPTLSLVIVADEATCTIDGEAGVTNKVWYQALGSDEWIDGGDIIGDGDVVISGLADGQYTFVAQSFAGTTPSIISDSQTGTVSTGVGVSLAISPASIIAFAIIDSLALMTAPSVAGTWPLYVGHMPDGKNVKDDAGATFDTSGLKDGALMASGLQIVHEGIQLRIRARDYDTGYAKAAEVVAALTVLSNALVVINTVVYEIQNVSQVGTIATLGMEEENKNRFMFTVNLLVTIAK